MVRKNDQILGGLESEVCSWRTIMTLIGGLVALEWKMGMEKKKKRKKFLQEDRAAQKGGKRSPFLSRGNPPPLRISRKRNRSGLRRPFHSLWPFLSNVLSILPIEKSNWHFFFFFFFFRRRNVSEEAFPLVENGRRKARNLIVVIFFFFFQSQYNL